VHALSGVQGEGSIGGRRWRAHTGRISLAVSCRSEPDHRMEAAVARTNGEAVRRAGAPVNEPSVDMNKRQAKIGQLVADCAPNVPRSVRPNLCRVDGSSPSGKKTFVPRPVSYVDQIFDRSPSASSVRQCPSNIRLRAQPNKLVRTDLQTRS
jgi:hypothetical protein